MNIEEKTKLAHEYLLRFGGTITVADAWQYADAMEAEAEERIKAKTEKDAEESKVFFEDLKDSLRKRPQEKSKQHDCNCSHWKNSSFFMGDTFTCKDCGGSVTI